jgi:uncharacterized protein YjbI with pentapeptide repeats
MDSYTRDELLQSGVGEARIGEMNLDGVDLSRRMLHAVDLKGFSIGKANFEGTDLTGADLRSLVLSSANCVSACFVGADLRGANLAFGFFTSADFSGADLRGARIADGLCSQCKFSGADLRGAVLGFEHYDSDFRGADLRGAIVPEASDFGHLKCDVRGALLTPRNAGPVSNKRRNRRVRMMQPLQTYDLRSNQHIGFIIDISSGGIRLSSLQPLPIDASFPFRVLLPNDGQEGRSIDLDVKSVWCRKMGDSGEFNTGFQFIRLSSEAQDSLRALLEVQKSMKLEITD